MITEAEPAELTDREALHGFLGLIQAMREGLKPGTKAHYDRAIEIAERLSLSTSDLKSNDNQLPSTIHDQRTDIDR